MTITALLLAIALILFILAAANVGGSINLTAAGLALCVLAWLAGHLN